MKDSTKKAIGVLAGVGVATGLVIALVKSAEAAEPALPPGGALTMKIYNQYGKLVTFTDGKAVAALPTGVTEGDTLSVVLTVANTSHKTSGGVSYPVPATLLLDFYSPVSGGVIRKSISLAAGETKTLTSTDWSVLSFVVPVGITSPASLSAILRDPNAVSLQTLQASIPVAALPVIYGGGIVCG